MVDSPAFLPEETIRPMIRIHSSLILLIFSIALFAHPGGRNAEGCHTNNKTGDYHCHDRKINDHPSQSTINTPSARTTTGNPIRRNGKLLRLDYQGFTVWLDCARRGAVKFRYVAHRDSGNAARYDRFFLDPDVPAECQQTTADAYGHQYDRGHLVPANHLDNSPEAIKATNTMTNILPQAANMNRGAWLATEEIIECYRDIDELLVIGGVIWRNHPEDDLFVKSHGVATPEAFWKAVIRGSGADETAIAWIVPNSADATKRRLDDYLVAITDLERLTGEKLPVADYAKHDKPARSWMIPRGCNKS